MTMPRLRFAFFFVLLAVALCAPVGAADKDLSKTPQAKIHEAQLKALRAGDYEGYRKTMTRAANEGIDKEIKESGMEPKKAMEFLKEMAPSDVKYTDLKVDGEKATLKATGKSMDEVNYGTIELEEEDGQWKIGQQSWTNKKETDKKE
jgi:hypothetical protein